MMRGMCMQISTIRAPDTVQPLVKVVTKGMILLVLNSHQSHFFGSYKQIEHRTLIEDAASSVGPVELVTVPALGPEWKRSEMRDMTKAGKREKKVESRAQKWKEWNRGERGLCGRWFTRKVLVFFLFGLAVVCVDLPWLALRC